MEEASADENVIFSYNFYIVEHRGARLPTQINFHPTSLPTKECANLSTRSDLRGITLAGGGGRVKIASRGSRASLDRRVKVASCEKLYSLISSTSHIFLPI